MTGRLALCPKLVCIAALAALATAPLTAGVVYEVETTRHSGSRGAETSTISVQGPNLKMEIQSGRKGDEGEVIFRGDRKQMVVVDHDSKSYMVMDEAALQAIGGQMQQAMKEMEKALEGLDPEQRKMAEQMMKGRMGGAAPGAPARPRIEFRRTSERATHAGYPTVRYDMLRDGEKVEEMWVTDWSNLEGSGEVKEAFEGMAAFYRDLMDSLQQMAGPMGAMFGDDNPMERFSEIDGFPVLSRSFEGGKLESETVLKSADRRTLDPSEFEPPAGYKRQSMGPR